jgi:hypothetical protein
MNAMHLVKVEITEIEIATSRKMRKKALSLSLKHKKQKDIRRKISIKTISQDLLDHS